MCLCFRTVFFLSLSFHFTLEKFNYNYLLLNWQDKIFWKCWKAHTHTTITAVFLHVQHHHHFCSSNSLESVTAPFLYAAFKRRQIQNGVVTSWTLSAHTCYYCYYTLQFFSSFLCAFNTPPPSLLLIFCCLLVLQYPHPPQPFMYLHTTGQNDNVVGRRLAKIINQRPWEIWY